MADVEPAASRSLDDDRAASIVRLVQIDAALQDWIAASQRLPLDQRRRLALSGPPNPTPHDPDGTLLRWRAIFVDDIALVHDVRNLVVHGVWVSEDEISSCVEIGERVLRLLIGGIDTPLA